ncbi:MAG: rhodanese-like domain-containing protein [Gammaproteobacteria bacterium]|nr:rhodanese-like domain-containing protein [Gammaproteobacteria bacterium]
MHEDPRALLIDVRSSMEFLFVGHPEGAVHVAWIDEPDWKVNENFTTDIRKLLLGGVIRGNEVHSAPIVLICRSGVRSLEAGQKLIDDGMTNVYHIDSGFEGDRDDHHRRSTINGWRFDGLPWEQC